MLILLVLCLAAARGWAQDKPHHGDGADDVLQHMPMAAVLALKAAGVDSRNGWSRLALEAGASYALTICLTYALKSTVSERRPDGTDHRSMPSGHTAFAFSGAAVLHREFGHVSPWISIAGYSVAFFTAADRVARNHHHWYDTVAGAGIGMLSAQAGYWLTDKLLPNKGTRVALTAAADGLTLRVTW